MLLLGGSNSEKKKTRYIRNDFLQIIGQADRRKAADMRQLKTAYENRLTQIQKSAKIEITRLVSYAQWM